MKMMTFFAVPDCEFAEPVSIAAATVRVIAIFLYRERGGIADSLWLKADSLAALANCMLASIGRIAFRRFIELMSRS
jgi:hypothetical protein